MRDVILQASGLLSDKVGGPSVNPVEPPGYLAALNFPKREYAASRGEDLYRRGLYTTWQRTYLHPSLLDFDRRRARVHHEPQHLEHTAPGTRFVERSDFRRGSAVFAQNAAAQGPPRFDAQLAVVFDRALNRAPTAEERSILRRLYQHNLKRFSANPASARAFLGDGETPLGHPAPANVNAARLAAMATITRAVLNLHELITRN